TQFIANEMDKSGLVLKEEDGRQVFIVSRGFEVTEKNIFYLDGASIRANEYTVLGFSATDTVTGKIVIAREETFEQAGTAKGKILVLPLPEDLPEAAHDAYGILRAQCFDAEDLGALAVIYVATAEIPDLNVMQRNPIGIPALVISSSVVLSKTGLSSEELNGLLASENPVSMEDVTIRIESEVLPGEITTYNTVGHLKGSDPGLSNQYVIIGAHHDHLGMGGRGSSSRRQDTVAVHYGADDNASGVAGVIELAQKLMSEAPARSMVFTTFGAEEMGLHGSKFFSENPTIDLASSQLMINLDMIGRLNEDRQLQIGGVGTSPVFRSILDSLNTTYNFTLAYADAGYGPSDHSSFYAKDVPVLFISTGAHPDYHTPADNAGSLNYPGMVEVLNYISDVALELANRQEKIAFTLAGPKEASGSRGRMGMVTFGLMPDVMYDGNEGMPVSFVTEGKPAAIGGMKGGDIIIAVDGKRVGNVQDYMERLSELKEGQSVVVTVLRDEKKIELLLKL
ncbi:M28 family peptidase, partial [Bacteroidota bacterium]